MSAIKLFYCYYQELCRSLPMNDETFLKKLKSHNMLTEVTNTMLDSLPTCTERASYFLDNIIKLELDRKKVEGFKILLNIMMKCKHEGVAELANTIKSMYVRKLEYI